MLDRSVLLCLLSVTVGVARGNNQFTDSIPDGYYLRKDLSDCSERFHQQKMYNVQCLIFGGTQVNVTEFPHMAVLGWPEEESENAKNGSVQWQCGGSLITERFVLTAAHCTADLNNIPPRLVRLGDVNLASSVDDEYGQEFEILRIVRHPRHRFTKRYFDLALIELDGVVSLTPGVCPACLWSNERHLPSELFEAVGFGETVFGGGSIPNLRKTVLRVTSHSQCAATYNRTRGLPEGIAPDQLCAAMQDTDTCRGDSGGPLQVTLRNFHSQHPFVVALTSFGRGCGLGSSGVYQQIGEHIAWIESVVNETMDHTRCTEKYARFRLGSTLVPECQLQNAYKSLVRLLWPEGANQSKVPCSGTLIDYNTVVTTASCTRNEDGLQPIEINIEYTDNRAQIVEIQVHPDYSEASGENDLALLRLDKYLNADKDIAPSCIPLPRSTEICTDRQTHDRIACWDKFAENIKLKLLNPVCRAARSTQFQASTVNLIWSDQDTGKPVCVGMIIKPDTVISSIRCMSLHGERPPVEVELIQQGTRVKIIQIFRHPGYREGSWNRDTALLVLAEEQHSGVPKCIIDLSNDRTSQTEVPVYGQYAGARSNGHLYLPVTGVCNGSMVDNFRELYGEKVSGSPQQYTCWDTNRQFVPGEVPLSRGAGLLDKTHRFIRGLVTGGTSFGSTNPLLSINLTSYADWITRFVLYRPPKEELVFRGGEDEFDLGSNCTLKNGTAGNCMPEYGCEREIRQHGSSKEITICGFEGTISYVCCPVGYQDFPPIPEFEIQMPTVVLPSLPYENMVIDLGDDLDHRN
uniref:Peptidase S1 domain-containing protein n=1 Tax=Anopheles farauti TaxID=69004 RepID=A0A182R0A0_9DIPT